MQLLHNQVYLLFLSFFPMRKQRAFLGELKIFFRRREDAMTAMKLLLRMSKHVLPPFNIFPNELISNYSQVAPKEEMVNYEARLQWDLLRYLAKIDNVEQRMLFSRRILNLCWA